MLLNLLPGLREIRAPLISGYVWLLFFYLLLHADLPTRSSAAEAIKPIFNLGDRLSVLGLATIASVAAYLVGSAMQEVLKGLGRVCSPQKPLFAEPGTRTTAAGEEHLRASVRIRVEAIVQKLFQMALLPGERGIENVPDRRQVSAELPMVRMMMLDEHPELVGELDRLQAEADLRIAVSVPLGALSVYLADVSSTGWLFGLFPAAMLLWQGYQRQRQAGDFLVGVLRIGKVDHPAVKTFELSVDAALERAELERQLRGEMAGGDGMAAFRYGNLMCSAEELEKAVEPLSLAAQEGVVEAYAQIGLVHQRLGQDQKAERAFKDGAERGDLKARTFLTAFLEKHQRPEEARETATPPEDSTAEPEPIDPSASQMEDYRSRIDAGEAKAALNLGILYGTQNRKQEAVEAFRTATDLDPDDSQAWARLGLVLNETGRFPEARAALETALRLAEKSLGPDHLEVARILNNLGNTMDELGEGEQARRAQLRALEIQEKELGPDHREVAISLNNLGIALQTLGYYEESKAALERALAVKERKAPASLSLALTQVNLGQAIGMFGEYERARGLIERALDIEIEALGESSLEVARTRAYLAETLRSLGETERALELGQNALRVIEADGASHAGDKLHVLDELGKIQLALGRPEESEALRVGAVELATSTAAPAARLAIVERGLGETLHVADRDEEALRCVSSAIGIQSQVLRAGHPELAKSFDLQAEVYEALGKLREARESKRRAAAVREEGGGSEGID